MSFFTLEMRLDRSTSGRYNPGMAYSTRLQRLPSLDRLSVVAAIILLAYALARFANLPVSELSVQLPGIFLSVQINLRTIVALLVTGLTASGADWMMRDHPALGRQNTLEHWLLPALTAWVIGLPLFQLPLNFLWWIGFALGGTILMLVLIAEYIVIDPDDIRSPVASAGLTVVSYALFLILAASLRYAGLRLYLILPALALAAGLVTLRILHLRLHGRWAFLPAGIVIVIIGQLTAALHYWPLSPVAYALVLLAPAYSLTSLLGNLMEEMPMRQAIIEPAIVLVVLWTAAAWIH